MRWAAALIGSLLPALAVATSVTVVSPRTVPITNPGATLDLLAYSEFTDAAGKTVKNKVASDPVVAGASIRPTTDRVPVPAAGLAPVVGFTGMNPKPAARRSVDSGSSGGLAGFDGRITYIPANDATMPSKQGTLYASAAHSIAVPGVGQGFSAVRGVDPDPLSAGAYDYTVWIDQLALDVSPGDTAWAGLFATDSRFTDPLWTLQVVATRPLAAGGIVWDIGFSSQGLFGLDDQAIRARVRRDLLAGGGQLSRYTLFSAPYDLPLAITYGEGLDAGVTTVPEPTTPMLLLFGGLVLLARRRGAGALAAALAALLTLLAPVRAELVLIDTRNPQGIPDITQTGSPIANGGICAAASAANLLWNWSEFAPFDGSAGGQRLVPHAGDANWPAGFGAWSADSLALRNRLVTEIYGTGNNGHGTTGGLTRYIKDRGHLYDSGIFGFGGNPNGMSVRSYNGANGATYARLYDSLYHADGSLKYAHAMTSWVWHLPDGSFVSNNNGKSRHSLGVAGMDVPRPGANDPGHRQIVLTNGWGSQQDRPNPVDAEYYDTYVDISTNNRLRIPADNGDNNDGNGNNYLVRGIPGADIADAEADHVEMYQFIVIKQGGSPSVGLSLQPSDPGYRRVDYQVYNPEATAQYHFFLEMDARLLSMLSPGDLSMPQGWDVEPWNPAGTVRTPETTDWDGRDLFAPTVASQGSAQNPAFEPGWGGLHWYWGGQSGAPIATDTTVTFSLRLPDSVAVGFDKHLLTAVGEADHAVLYFNMIGGPTLVPVPESSTAALLAAGLLMLAGWARRAGRPPSPA
ncbi:MAG: PEP-CTERM sorting domain-containing protein [Burkholderiaceae bacterium]|nr:PEP-CTERM sorting domain-containing protein [Burkholderiaceae bacterium]